MLVNSCTRNLDSKGMSLSSNACAARLREKEKYAVSKIRRPVRVKITIEDRKRGNMAEKFKREKSVSERRRTNETKSLRLHSVQ